MAACFKSNMKFLNNRCCCIGFPILFIRLASPMQPSQPITFPEIRLIAKNQQDLDWDSSKGPRPVRMGSFINIIGDSQICAAHIYIYI